MPRKQNHDTDLTRDLKSFLLKRRKTGADMAAQEEQKPLNIQVLLGELESLVKNMDQGDARVQRITGKLYELKTAILIALENN